MQAALLCKQDFVFTYQLAFTITHWLRKAEVRSLICISLIGRADSRTISCCQMSPGSSMASIQLNNVQEYAIW